eukprot:19766-Eustigmatos_ZCMA.PRE.1
MFINTGNTTFTMIITYMNIKLSSRPSHRPTMVNIRDASRLLRVFVVLGATPASIGRVRLI